jgi:cell division protein FtsB
MKNLTNHFNERWVQRIVGITTEREIKDYISKNKQMISEHANETIERAEFLWKGQIGDNVTRNYYIKDDIILITNTGDDALITVYKIDFGFPEDVNKMARRRLTDEVKKLTLSKIDLELQVMEQVDKAYHEADILEEQIKLLKEQIDNLEKQRAFKKDEAKMLQSKSLNTGLELKRYTMMLVNSQEYKEDLRSIR